MNYGAFDPNNDFTPFTPFGFGSWQNQNQASFGEHLGAVLFHGVKTKFTFGSTFPRVNQLACHNGIIPLFPEPPWSSRLLLCPYPLTLLLETMFAALADIFK